MISQRVPHVHPSKGPIVAKDPYFKSQVDCIDVIVYALNETFGYMKKVRLLRNEILPIESLPQAFDIIQRNWDAFDGKVDPIVSHSLPKLRAFAKEFERYRTFRLGSFTRGDMNSFLAKVDLILEYLNDLSMGEFLKQTRAMLDEIKAELNP
jgi:hypothetical protein